MHSRVCVCFQFCTRHVLPARGVAVSPDAATKIGAGFELHLLIGLLHLDLYTEMLQDFLFSLETASRVVVVERLPAFINAESKVKVAILELLVG